MTKPATAKPVPTQGMNLFQWLMRILQGVLIGIGAMLPGISGGALSVLFGIYQPMMALLSHPFKTFKRYVGLFIPIILGVGIGFVGSAKLLSTFFEANELMMVCLFVGLILGVLPSLFREAGAQGRTRKGKISLAISFCALLALLIFLQYGVQISIAPNAGWFLLCGVVWGLSMVVPGLSSSNILIFLGLYQPMSDGIGSLQLSVLIPMGIGFAATILLLARTVSRIFEKQYEAAYHCILGTVIASTVMIIPFNFASVGEVALGVLVALAGFGFALWMDRWGEKLKRSQGV